MHDVLVGNFLGDGNLTIYEGKKKSTARFTHAQTGRDSSHTAYNVHVCKIFGEITQKFKPTIRQVKFDGEYFDQSVFNTSFYEELYNDYYVKFFVPGGENEKPKRVISRKEMESWMNARVFSYWFMDDGNGSDPGRTRIKTFLLASSSTKKLKRDYI